ncbi:MAG: aspartate carbamoyltransferase, partial [Chloroflexi bacterium]|nr:aspartate carbamoyltransferase [Chloroflexota bacterium]
PTVLPPDFGDLLNGDGMVRVEYDLDRAIEGADVVMALRIQKERMAGGLLPDLREYARRWGITTDRLGRADRQVLLMHPGPMNQGIEISSDVAYGEQSVITEQVTNGVAVRMAILYLLLTGAH